MTHLSEEERQGMADGSLPQEQLAAADAHLRSCAECSADVDRIRRLMKAIDGSRSASGANGVEELWPGIRARIEQEKVVALGSGNRGSASGNWWRPWRYAIGGVAAATLLGMWLARGQMKPAQSVPVAEAGDSGVSLIAVVDSTHVYQEEAQALLNHLELERATLRPELARALERDLKTIDVAIAELQDAIRNDPANPALRRLLASSYRQKVDLLKRVSNAG